MTDLSKDEVVSMAREAGAAPEDGVNGFWVAQTEDLQRLIALARAPLVAENAALKAEVESTWKLSEAAEQDNNALKAELAQMKVGEPVAEVRAKSDKYGGTFVLWKKLPVAGMNLYTAAPQPSAVKVVQQMMKALDELYVSAPTTLECEHFHHSASERHGYLSECRPAKQYEQALANTRAALAAGQKFLGTGGKESGE